MSSSSSSGSNYERYKLVELIGKGSFGDVYKGYDSATSRDVAIKVIDLEDIEEDIAEIQKEINMLKTCRSPNITEYYGSSVVPGTTQLMIVMELLAVSISDLVDDDNGGVPLPEACIAFVLREVLNALVYLHSERRIHRDVKAANILLSRDGLVKVSDFGVSAQLGGTVAKRRTFVGSPLWMAPEVIEQGPDTHPSGNGRLDSDGYDEQADIWSLGITAIEMAKGQPPRADINSIRLLFMIVRDDPPALDGDFSNDFKDFVWQCLRKDPAARPSAMELLEHPFVMHAEKPPEFEAIIAQHLHMRPPMDQRRSGNNGTASSANYGTVPRWDFAANEPNAAATLRAQPSRPATVNGSAAPPQQADSGAAAAGLAQVQEEEEVKEEVQEAAAPAKQFDTVKAVAPAARMAVAAVAAAAAAAMDGTGTVHAALGSGTVRRVEIPDDPILPDRPAAASESTVLPTPNGGVPQGAPDSAPLQSLILPALASTTRSNPQAAAAAQVALAALSRLETAQPGANRSLVGEMLAMLSVSSSPSLQSLKSSAEAVFGGGSAPDGSKAPVADMGPLGNFLLARWRESAARERMQHSHYAS